MKIAFLIDRYSGPNAGTERQMLLLTQSVQAAGHEVVLAVFQHTPYTETGAFPAPVECLDVGRVSSPISWWRVYRWAKAVRQSGVDVVQIFFNDPSLFAPYCLAKAGLPCLVSRRDMGFWYTPLRLMLLRRMQRYAAAMVANSEAVAKFCGDAEGFATSKRVIVYNAIVRRATREAEITDKSLTIGLVANIRPIKRIGDAVLAINRLRREEIDVRLRVVGGGDASELSALVDTLGLSDRVELVGPSDDVTAELQRIDIGVLCSQSEGLSNAIMEYMQAGLPVVATETGGNGELVTDGKGGFLYSVGDVKELSECLEILLRSPAQRRAMGNYNAQQINQRFSPEVIAARYIELFRSHVGRVHDAPMTREEIEGRQR